MNEDHFMRPEVAAQLAAADEAREREQAERRAGYPPGVEPTIAEKRDATKYFGGPKTDWVGLNELPRERYSEVAAAARYLGIFDRYRANQPKGPYRLAS